MNSSRLLRTMSLSIVPILSFAALAFASMMDTKPGKKPPAYPLSLFAQAAEEDYVGDKKCVGCHKNYVESFDQSPHAAFSRDPHRSRDRQGCESCHGPGKPHIDHLTPRGDIPKYAIGYTRAKPRESSEACMRCHADTLSESHWRRTGHARANVGCADCHQIHQNHVKDAKELKAYPSRLDETGASKIRAPFFVAAPDPRKMLKGDEASLCGKCHRREVSEFRHNFHHPIPEGRMVCSDCHEPHPNKDAPKHVRPGKQMCVSCHAETAGPFVFEHDFQTGGEDGGCTECHRPHGSPNPKLLRLFSRGLCNQCHSDKSVNHFPGRTCWQSGCHVAIHGSNSSARFFSR